MSRGIFLGIRRFLLIFLASIFLSLHYASTLFVNSSFLGKFFSPSGISFFFILGAVASIILFIKVPVLLNRWSKRGLFLTFLTLEAISMTGLALATTGISAGFFFIIYFASLPILYYLLDIFLEDISLNEKTGEIRGLYLTFMNASIALGPLFVAGLVLQDNFTAVYLLALALLGPIYIAFLFFPSLGQSKKKHEHFSKIHFHQWLKNINIRRVTLVRFVLNFFYALMTIFTPIYLRSVLGFEWSEIGIIFTIMLLPFVIFEWPMGELGDRYFGEKEIMTLGLFIMGTALLLMPFLDKNFTLWASVLFLSRIGASWVEISTESYFFKKVESNDTGLISIFRLTSPVSTVFGAFLGGLIIYLLPFNLIFFFIAFAVLLGMKESLFIHDTR